MKQAALKLARRIKRKYAPAFVNQHADYIEQIINKVSFGQDPQKLKENLEEICISNLQSQKDRNAAAEILESEGIFVIPNFFDSHKCDEIKKLLQFKITSNEKVKGTGNADIELDNIYIHKTGKKFISYTDRQNFHKAIADIRGGKDKGMIDIFNADLAFSELKELRLAFENPQLAEVIKKAGYESACPTNLNIYINKDILTTRGFHIDSVGPNLKGFIYLSDIKTMDKGPYCYVRQSHRDQIPARSFNQAFSHKTNRTATDAPFVDPFMVTPVLARKGDLVVSDQSGIHRGYPQSPGSERFMAVMRYK